VFEEEHHDVSVEVLWTDGYALAALKTVEGKFLYCRGYMIWLSGDAVEFIDFEVVGVVRAYFDAVPTGYAVSEFCGDCLGYLVF
jgi:hypothetical protein